MKKNRLWIASLTLVLGVGIAGTDAKHSPFGGPSPAAPGQESQGQLRQFSGSPIDVDYQSANLRTVLRQLSEIGGINLVIDPSVPTAATVDLKLNQVPWDQVMDVVLRTSGLTYDLQGPVLRVLTREARTKELQDQALQKKASEAAPDLVTMRKKLNYANSEDV